MPKYRVPPFEMNRILQVVRREPSSGCVIMHFRRRDGLPHPYLMSLPSWDQDADSSLLMLDGAVFAAHGIDGMGERFWRCRNEDGIWFAVIE